MDLDSIIEQAKNAVSAIIQRPKMTEKLLARPPFRFLHDTVTAISVATNFAEGLYSESELDSAALTEKQQKLDYLEKIINMVGICKVNFLSTLLLSSLRWRF
jgi:TRAF3-interacting protein 1